MIPEAERIHSRIQMREWIKYEQNRYNRGGYSLGFLDCSYSLVRDLFLSNIVNCLGKRSIM